MILTWLLVKASTTNSSSFGRGKIWAKKQYSGRECLEISGIPESIHDDELEDCVLKIFNECDTPVDPANIEACHRLKLTGRPKKIIIKLSKRKDEFSILQRKKKLKSVDITKVGLPQGSLVILVIFGIFFITKIYGLFVKGYIRRN